MVSYYTLGDEVNFGIETNKWDSMSDYEKISCLNRVQNYTIMKALGFDITIPEFLKPSPLPKLKRLSNETVTQLVKKLKIKESEFISSNEMRISCEQKTKLKNGLKPGDAHEAKHPETSEFSDIAESEEQHVRVDKVAPFTFSYEEISSAVRTYNIFNSVSKIWHRIKMKFKTLGIITLEGAINDGVKLPTETGNIKTNVSTKKRKVFDDHNDELLFCDICRNDWIGACPFHGPLLYLADNESFPEHSFIRALYTTPIMLKIIVSENGLGVWTYCTIPFLSLFGPYEGEIVSQPDDSGFSWHIMKNGKVSHYISGLNVHTSNWMRYVNFAQFENEINLLAFQYKGNIYYRTCKEIPPKTELKVWYMNKYHPQLERIPEIFDNENLFKDNTELITCFVCKSAFHSQLFLKTHMKYNHRKRERKLKIKRETTNETESDSLEHGMMRLNESKLQVRNKTELGLKNGRKTEIEKNYLQDGINIESKFIEPEYENEQVVENISQTEDECLKDGMIKLIERKLVKTEHINEQGISNKTSNELQDIESRTKQNEWENNRRGCRPAYENQWKTVPCSKLDIWKCNECKFKCKALNELKQHILIKHSNVKLYTCLICEHTFKEMGRLNLHMRTHSGDKLYRCEHCDYTSVLLGNMRRHMRIHTGEKPFKCEKCKLCFRDIGHLNRHIQIHSDEKPFHCDFCDYKSKNLCTLKRHIRIHTGERPFACSQCSFTCNQSSNLNTHLKIHDKYKH